MENAPRRRWPGVLQWVAALLIVPTGMAAAITVSQPEEEAAELRELHPLDIGTTWHYEVTNNGAPSGTRTRQVVSQAGLGDTLLETVVMRSHYTDFPGQGPRTSLTYMGFEGDALLQYALFSNNEHTELEPPAPAYELPIEEGKSWSYSAPIGENVLSFTAELVEIDDIEVGGKTFTDCAHYMTDSRFSGKGFEPSIETYEEWTCPGFGPVRLITTNEDDDVHLTEDLIAFHGAPGNWTAETTGGPPEETTDAPPEEPGTTDPVGAPGHTVGFDAGRTGYLPEGQLRIDELAWTDTRSEAVEFPPVGSGDVLITGEVDGSVTALNTSTGQIDWRLRLEGPIIAPPVVAGEAVLVADAAKNLWALDMATGAARWVDAGDDQVSVSPAVWGDRAVVVRDDRHVTARSLEDGTELWSHKSVSLVRAPPAVTEDSVIIVNEDGDVAALDLDTGDTLWDATTFGIPTAGPAVGEGVVVVTDRQGTIYGFDAATGDLKWERILNINVFRQPALADGKVILIAGTTRLMALDQESGDIVWESALGSDHYTSPSVVGDEVVTVSYEKGSVRTWNLADGTLGRTRSLPVPTTDAGIFTELQLAVTRDALVVTSEVEAPGHETTFSALPITEDFGAPGLAFATEARAVPASPFAPPALIGETLFVAGQDEVLYRSTTLSDVEIVHKTKQSQPFAVAAGDTVLVQKDAELLALPVEGGAPRWSFPVSEPFAGSVPAVQDGVVFVPEYNLGLAAVDLASGAPLWFQQIPNSIGTTQPVPLTDGDVVYGAGVLARYDGATGEPKWQIKDLQLFSSAAHDDGIVFVGAIRNRADSGLLAVDAETGDIIWQREAVNTIVAGPAAADGVVVSPDSFGKVTAYGGPTGEELWSLKLDTPVGGTPFIHDGKVYISEIGREEDVYQREYRIVVKDLQTGEFLGAFQPPGQGYQQFPAIGPAAEGILAAPTTTHLGATIMLLRPDDE